MRHALPIFWCLDYATQVKLAKMLDNLNSIPPCLWKEWPGIEQLAGAKVSQVILDEVDYDREMRKPPSRSRG